MQNLNELMVIFTVYFDPKNVQKPSRKHYDENNSNGEVDHF